LVTRKRSARRTRGSALKSAHDIAEGGLAVALAECCLAGGRGARVRVPEGLDVFAEAPGQGFVVTGAPDALAGFQIIGAVGGEELELEGQLKLPLSALREARERGLPQWL